MRAVVAMLVVLAGRANADVRVHEPSAFSTEELVEAVRVRLAPDAPLPDLEVHASAGVVEVTVGTRTRAVRLADKTGRAAARLVALVIVDLIDAAPPVATAPPPRVAPAFALVPMDEPELPPIPAPAPAISLVGSTALWSSVLASAGVDAAVATGWGRVTGSLELGQLADSTLAMTAAFVRLGHAWRSGGVELRAGAIAAPVLVSGGHGDSTMLLGGYTSLRVAIPLGGVRLVGGIGVDAFAMRSVYHRTGMSDVATPWVAPTASVALEVTP